jgi:hypothetical protein
LNHNSPSHGQVTVNPKGKDKKSTWSRILCSNAFHLVIGAGQPIHQTIGKLVGLLILRVDLSDQFEVKMETVSIWSGSCSILVISAYRAGSMLSYSLRCFAMSAPKSSCRSLFQAGMIIIRWFDERCQ